MCNLCRPKIGLLFVFIFLSLSEIFAQRNTILHQQDYDAKQVHFGYFLGVSASNYRIRHGNIFLSDANTDFKSIISPIDYGLKMGGMMNFYVNPSFDIKTMATVAIYSRKLLVNEDPDLVPSRDQAWFEIPVLLKYKSIRRGNARMNMFVGFRQGFETNAVNLVNKNKIGRIQGLKTSDLSVEYGAGLELFRQYFKLAPEVHFSHGIKNLLKENIGVTKLTPFSVLDRLNTHTVTFYLFFE